MSRCVYVDADPVAVAHTEVMLDLRGDPNHAVIHADLRAAEYLWTQVLGTGVLDPEQPMALILSSTLPFIPRGDDAENAITQYKRVLPTGSMLIASHVTTDGASAERKRQLAELEELGAHLNPPVCYRTRAEFAAIFADLALVEPGVVRLPQWRPSHTGVNPGRSTNRPATSSCLLAAVGRKP